MTKNEVVTTFSDIIENMHDEDVIVIEKGDKGEVIFISVDDFYETFADYNLTYESLKTHPYFNAGWKEVFDEWRSLGYIS